MSTVPSTNADVISLFRTNHGQVPSPFEDDPPPMIIMHTLGARSGKEHLVPLRAIPAGDDLLDLRLGAREGDASGLVLQHEGASRFRDRDRGRAAPGAGGGGDWSGARPAVRRPQGALPGLCRLRAEARSHDSGHAPFAAGVVSAVRELPLAQRSAKTLTRASESGRPVALAAARRSFLRQDDRRRVPTFAIRRKRVGGRGRAVPAARPRGPSRVMRWLLVVCERRSACTPRRQARFAHGGADRLGRSLVWPDHEPNAEIRTPPGIAGLVTLQGKHDHRHSGRQTCHDGAVPAVIHHDIALRQQLGMRDMPLDPHVRRLRAELGRVARLTDGYQQVDRLLAQPGNDCFIDARGAIRLGCAKRGVDQRSMRRCMLGR